MKIVPAYLLAVPLVVDSIVKLEFKMRYDEGGLKVTTTHLSRASIFPVYPALLVRGLIVITPYNEWIEYMDTNCMQIYHTMSGTKWTYFYLIKLQDRQCLFFFTCRAKLYIPSTPNNSNETHTFMCLGRTGRFGQR